MIRTRGASSTASLRDLLRRPSVTTDTSFCADGLALSWVGNRRQRDGLTIVNTLLLRPWPFERADDVVRVKRRTHSVAAAAFRCPIPRAHQARSALSALAISMASVPVVHAGEA